MTTIDQAIIAALSAAPALGFAVYPQVASQDAKKPFVIYRRTSEPVMTIHGYAGITSHDVIFECWANRALDASAVALALRTRIASTAGLVWEQIAAPENDYAPDTDEFLEHVAFRFWK
jgi:hypothetical protein